MLEFVVALLLILTAVLLWTTNVLGLPGNWLVLAVAIPYAYWVDSDRRLDIGIGVLVAMCVLATIGELLEFFAGAVGASQAGGSKRGTALAMVGSLVGGVVGMFVGAVIPIPVVGSVVGALLFASIGALAGAVLGEKWKGRNLDESMKVGHAAFWGRFLGTVAKIVCGVGMLALLLAAILF